MTDRIDITFSDETSLVDVQADIDVLVQPNESDPEQLLDISDLLTYALCSKLKTQASFPAGKYNIRLMLVITSEKEET